MKKNWVKGFTIFIYSILLLIPAVPVPAAALEAPDQSSSTISHKLVDSINAEVKSVVIEKVSKGKRTAVVVGLYNQGSRIVRVPDYEVRARTRDGVEYALSPSAGNAKAIQPKEKVELSYMNVVNREDAFSLSKITWTAIDANVYPKKEKTILSIPVSSLTLPIEEWGQSFRIPVLSSTLEYTPISSVWGNTGKGAAYLVIIQVENKGDVKELIPDLRIDGKSNNKIYIGKREAQGQGDLALEPSEKDLLYFTIPTENGVKLDSINILTPENFIEADQKIINYSVGRVDIQLPAELTFDQADGYEMGKPIRLMPFNKLIDPQMAVSVSQLHMFNAEGNGFKTAVVSLTFENRSDSPMPIPSFSAQIMSGNGSKYPGNRQIFTEETLAPGFSCIIPYSFNVPVSEQGDKLALILFDSQSMAPFNIPIAGVRLQVSQEDSGVLVDLYPFQVKLTDWAVLAVHTADSPYTYSLKLNLDLLRKDNVIVDRNFNKMKFVLFDPFGSVLGSETVSFTGANRLMSGWHTIHFTQVSTDQLVSPLTLLIYESIDTPDGEATRLLKTLQQ